MIGKRLSHFVILEPLGSGGMGDVYRARDERLGRLVAIKVLPPHALADEAARRQFRKEALALSRLSHANIAVVYEVDSQDGIDFLVLELASGITLSERLRSGPLPEKETARLGVQLAEGLAAAHAERILHCDIKPGNLQLTQAGQLKILDFGLARLGAPPGSDRFVTLSMTDPGHIAGTLPYMAPEQLRGESLDPRTDLYAAGAVLYEMVSAERAFPQEPAARAITAILGERPAPLLEVAAGASGELDRIVTKCLEKEPSDRYQSAADLAVDLRHLGGAGAPSPGPLPRKRSRGRKPSWMRAAVVGAFALVGLASICIGANLGGIRDRLFGVGGGVPHGAPSLAVLPLANLSGDSGQDYFADGMTDELITRLAQVAALRVISRSSVMPYKETKKPLAQIARELGVRMVVEGTVLRAGDAVRISAQLIEAATGRAVWAEAFERPVANVLALQSEVAQAIVNRVEVKLSPSERGLLANAPKVDPVAHEEYLRGLADYNQFNSEALRRATAHFQKAIQIDPGYAPAYVALANVYPSASGMYLSASEAMPRARAAALKALEIDPSCGAAHSILGIAKFNYDWDPQGAESEFREALRLSPGDATVHQNYAAVLVSLGRTKEAIAEFGRAREIDPLSDLVASWSLWPLFEGRRYREAANVAQDILNSGSNLQNARMVHGQALFFLGDRVGGIAEIRKATEADPGNPFPLAWLGFVSGMAGQKDEARQILTKLETMRQKQYLQPYLFAIVQIGLGDKDEAFRILSKAVDEKSDELLFIRVDPALDTLRSDPRFHALLKRMGITV